MFFKTIIFDFDGVIVDSVGVKTRAFYSLFQGYPDHVEKVVEFHLAHGGISRYEKFEIIYRDILREKLSIEKKNELGIKFADLVLDEVIKCPFINGAAEFLSRYHERMSFFLVSGTPHTELLSIVKKRNLAKYFIDIFGTPGKKSEHNIEIMRKYNIDSRHILVVGDSIDDYLGAKEAGLRFVGKINGANPFENIKTEALIHNLFDLEKVINEANI